MAINFPASPNVNDTHTAAGVTYKWDGDTWLAQGVTGLYTLPTATDTNLGGVKVGKNLDISNSILSVTEPLSYDQTVGTAANPIILNVRRAAKTAANQWNGEGSSNCFYINDLEAPPMQLVVGKTYRFDQSDASNAGHTLKLYGRETKKHASNSTNEYDQTIWLGRDVLNNTGASAYGTFVTFNGTPGSAGAYTQVEVNERCNDQYYYQSNDVNTQLEGNVLKFLGVHGVERTEDLWLDSFNMYSGHNVFFSDLVTESACIFHAVNAGQYGYISYDVRVRDKSSANQYDGQGSTKCFELSRRQQNSTENVVWYQAPHLTLIPGNKYRFYQEDATNVGYAFKFYTDKDATTFNQIQDGSQGFVLGTGGGGPGSSGAYTELEIRDTTPGLIYYMVVGTGNEYMGGMATCGTATGTGGGGGGGTPGGANTQIQYNNSGAFGGTTSLLVAGDDIQFIGAAANVTWDKSANTMLFGDDAYANFGAGEDLKVYHNQTNGNFLVGAATVPLTIQTDTFTVKDAAGANTIITGTTTGVSLNHGGNAKVTTTAGGAVITGTITAGGLTYPSTDGAAGEFLKTDGAGNLSWQSAGNSAIPIDDLTDVDTVSVAPTNGQVLKWNGTNWAPSDDLTGGSGSGLATRTTSSVATSGTHANNTAEDVTFGSVGKTYALLRIQTSHAAWVTLYTDTTSRTNDAGRNENSDPLPGNGVIAEVITTDGSGQMITPGTIGFNMDPSPTENVYAKVVNKSGATRPITITITFVQLEG